MPNFSTENFDCAGSVAYLCPPVQYISKFHDNIKGVFSNQAWEDLLPIKNILQISAFPKKAYIRVDQKF